MTLTQQGASWLDASCPSPEMNLGSCHWHIILIWIEKKNILIYRLHWLHWLHSMSLSLATNLPRAPDVLRSKATWNITPSIAGRRRPGSKRRVQRRSVGPEAVPGSQRHQDGVLNEETWRSEARGVGKKTQKHKETTRLNLLLSTLSFNSKNLLFLRKQVPWSTQAAVFFGLGVLLRPMSRSVAFRGWVLKASFTQNGTCNLPWHFSKTNTANKCRKVWQNWWIVSMFSFLNWPTSLESDSMMLHSVPLRKNPYLWTSK